MPMQIICMGALKTLFFTLHRKIATVICVESVRRCLLEQRFSLYVRPLRYAGTCGCQRREYTTFAHKRQSLSRVL